MSKYSYQLYLIILSFCLFCLSCKSKSSQISFDENIIKSISQEESFPIYLDAIFFAQGDNNKILELNCRELKEIYDENNYNIDFETFVREVLNQKIKITSNKRKSFILDEEIKRQYENIPFNEFIEIYSKKQEDDIYRLRDDLAGNKLLCVCYYGFLNNYLFSEDDYSGVSRLISTRYYIE